MADPFAAAAKALRGVADDLDDEVYAAFARSARQVGADVLDLVAPDLPQRGGFAREVRAATVTPQDTGKGGAPEMTLVFATRKAWDLVALEAGTIHHLTFGRGPTKTQRVTGGLFSRAFAQRAAADLAQPVSTVLDELVANVTGK